MKKNLNHTLLKGMFLALVGFACVALLQSTSKAEEDDDWMNGGPHPPISGNGWAIDEDGIMTVVSDAGWQDFLANGPGDWLWEFRDDVVIERVQKLVIGKNVTTLSIYDPTRMNKAAMMEYDYILNINAGIYKPYMTVYNQDPKCMPPKIEVEQGNGVFSVENGLLINNIRRSVVLSELDVSDVVIPDGIREIESWAFYYRNVTSVTFPNTLEVIGAAAFAGCKNLTNVTLPDSVMKIETCAFMSCSALRDVTLSKNLKTMEGIAFKDCAIEEITIPSSLQIIDFSSFRGCSALKTVHLPEGVTRIGNFAFSECTMLEEITLPSSLTYIGYHAFENCTSWKLIRLPDTLNTIGEEAFLGCKPILIQLPKQLVVEAVPAEERGWSVGLEEEEPSTRLLGFDYVNTLIVSGSEYSMGSYAVKRAGDVVFLGKPPADWKQITTKVYSGICNYLDKFAASWNALDKSAWNGLQLNKLTRAQVNGMIKDYEEMAAGEYVEDIYVEDEASAEDAQDQVFEREGWSYSSDGVLTIRSNDGWLNWLRQNEFEHPSQLVIGKDVTELAFYDMSETVSIPGFYHTKDITGYAVNGAPIYSYQESSFISAKKIYLEPGNKVFIYGDGMLVNTHTMEIVLADGALPLNVVLPNWVRSIGNGAFNNRILHTIELPQTLEKIGAHAFEKSGLRSINIPDSVTSIGKYAFSGCKSLTEIRFPENLKVIEEGTFSKCGLRQIVLPDMIIEIGEYAFYYCPNLEHVQLPVSLEFIGLSAFEDCKSLKYIRFSDHLESIAPWAFNNCSSLKKVLFPNSLRVIGERVFGKCDLSLLRLPPELHLYEYDFYQRKFNYGVTAKEDVNLGMDSIESIVFSGSVFELGDPAFVNATNTYFQSVPPAYVSEWLPKKTAGNIFCSETYKSEWSSSSVASWVRKKITFLPAAQIDDWMESLLSATPEPTNTPRPTFTPKPTKAPWITPQPTVSPAPTDERENQSTDPIIILLIAFIVLIIAATVLLYLKPWAKKKKRRKKHKKMPQLPAAAQAQIEPEETEKTEQRE